MARRPQVRYFKSRGAYFCQLNGKQHKLATGPDDGPSGPTFAAATKAYAGLISLAGAPNAHATNTVRVVAELYLRYSEEAGRRPQTLKIRQRCLGAFISAGWGERAVASLTILDIQAFTGRMRRPPGNGSEKRARAWNGGTVRLFLQSLRAAFRWGVQAGLLANDPVARAEQPPARSRGREAILDPSQHAQLLKLASRHLRPVVVVLEATGARPGEIAGATAGDYDAQLGALVYHQGGARPEDAFCHKTAGKGKDRVILLTGEALEIVRERVRAGGKGPLFKTRAGRPWTSKSIAKGFAGLRERTGIPALTAYSYRHTFATAWLRDGGSIDHLAELLGNTPAVIRRHYSHLCGERDALRARLEAFKAGGTTQTPKPTLRVVGE